MKRQRIAVIGAGVSGLVASYVLSPAHDVTLFESSERLGGHAHAVKLDDGVNEFYLDTAFLIFNSHSYPNFLAFLQKLNLLDTINPSPMSIGFYQRQQNLLYAVNDGINSLFGQRLNLLSPRFLKLVCEINKFRRNHDAKANLGSAAELPLGEYLRQKEYSEDFAACFAYPMGASVWSLPRSAMIDFPAKLFLNFFSHHNLLKHQHGAKWQTMRGGSIQYIQRFQDYFKGHIRLNQRLRGVERSEQSCSLLHESDEREHFDYVIFATPADQSLKLLLQPTDLEKKLLGAWAYEPSQSVLHTDGTVFPRIQGNWPSWSITSTGGQLSESSYQVNYYLNRIQSVKSQNNYFVTLGDTKVSPDREIRRFEHRHVIFTPRSLATQSLLPTLNQHRSFFCGSYFGRGFHEDAVKSALAVTTQHFDRGF